MECQEEQMRKAIEQSKNNFGQATKVKVRKIIINSISEDISDWDKRQEVDAMMTQAMKDGIITIFSSDIVNDNNGKISWRDEVQMIDDEEERKRIWAKFH